VKSSLVALLLALPLLSAATTSKAAAAAIGGRAPTYTTKQLSAVPNAAALRVWAWSPGLDEGYVPQAVARAGERFFVITYQSPDESQPLGEGRVFELDATGAVCGQFVLPDDIQHPGGLAIDGNDAYVANFGTLLRLDLARSLARGRAVVTGRRAVERAMGPSFVTAHEGQLWFGRFAREGAEPPRLYAVDVAKIFPADRAAPLRPSDASREFAIPLLVQGAAFDRAGRLWLSASVQKEGWLYRYDSATGRELARHAASPGIEGLVAGAADRLWSVGECGTRRWLKSSAFYPVVFEIDLTRLR
jgi:hypothetical protein